MNTPLVLGLFEKRIEGDDALLELARLRFQQAGLGAEMHASAPDKLEERLKFRPSPDTPVVLHLPRELNLAEPVARGRIVDFATRFAGRLYGLVLHDHPDLAWRSENFLQAALEMESWLEKIPKCPLLFVEFAAGLAPDQFARFFESIRSLSRITACIDTGHVGIWRIRQAYSQIYPGQDICSLKSQPPNLLQLMPDVDRAVATALPAVLNLVERLGALGKPIHFHLHDGHPLSTFSPFGVADHLSFLAEIPLGFEYRGRRSVPLMFGPGGLKQLLNTTLMAVKRPSFTLEIHPTSESLPLDPSAAPLFAHWADKTNAEKMNHWLSILTRNQSLLLETPAPAPAPPSASAFKNAIPL